MKLADFLKRDGINIYDNSDPLANEIKFNVSQFVDFEKNIYELVDDEIYQVFAHLIMMHNKGKAFSYYEIVEIMKNEFSKVISSK